MCDFLQPTSFISITMLILFFFGKISFRFSGFYLFPLLLWTIRRSILIHIFSNLLVRPSPLYSAVFIHSFRRCHFNMREFIPSALYAWSLAIYLFLLTPRIKTATPASPMLIRGEDVVAVMGVIGERLVVRMRDLPHFFVSDFGQVFHKWNDSSLTCFATDHGGRGW